MPTYQYSCTECGHFLEVVQSFSDDSLTVCPECEGRLRKVFNAVGVVFKGSGFYRTDSRSGGSEGSGGSGGSGSTGSGTGGSKDSKDAAPAAGASTAAKDSGGAGSSSSSGSKDSSGSGSKGATPKSA